MGQRSKATIDPKREEYYLLDNFVPLVVPGLYLNSGGSSSSTSLSQESLSKEADQASGNRAASSSSSSSIFERSDEQATRRLGQESLKIQIQNRKRDDKKNADGPLADLLYWLVDFKDNLVDAELLAPAHISREPDWEHLVEVVTESKKHRIYTHFPKNQICDVCLRTKITEAPCRRRIGETVPRTVNFGDLITADRKVLNEGCESRDKSPMHCRRTRSCYSMDSILSAHETEKSLLTFLEPSHRPKVENTDNSSVFGRACEDLSWHHRTCTLHRSETKWHR